MLPDGGSLQPHGRHCTPESYIRRIRQLIDRAGDKLPYGRWQPRLRVAQDHPVVADIRSLGVDRDNPGVKIIHRSKAKSLSRLQRRWLRRSQPVEPVIGHLKPDHRMDHYWLRGQLGDALHAALCAGR